MFYLSMYLVTYFLLLFIYCFFFQKQPPKCSVKKAVLENFIIFTRKYRAFLIQWQAFRHATLSKIDSNAGVSLRISQIFKNICSEKYLRTTADSDFSQEINVALLHIIYSVFPCFHPFTRS